MSHRLWGAALALAMIFASPAARADAQGLTGQISGVVTDSGGGVMPGATVTVKNVGTNLTREAVTGADGVYTITNLLAGTFDLTVTVQGFKPYEQKGIVLGATERLALRAIALEIGGLSEVVSVAAESVKVQTTSGERSATITAGQIEDIGLSGRDFMGTLKTLPGVIDTSARDAPGWGSVGGMTINGQNSFNFSYDGVTNKDTGSNSGNYAAPALDSIAEVKVQASNFQAEYGRSSGATITVVTKSGTRDFHGTAAYYKRNEKFNANTWDRRRQCDARPASRAATRRPTGSTTRRGRSAVRCSCPAPTSTRTATSCSSSSRRTCCRATIPATLQLSTMPTALERDGDFSQTFDSQGRLVCIKDPQLAAQGLACNVNTGGPGCFAGQHHSGQPHQPDRAADAQPVPAAERDRSVRQPAVQLHVPERAREAAQRPGGARRLQHHAGTRRSTRACSSATRSTRAARTPSSAPARATAATPAGRSSTPRTRSDRSAW